MWAKQCHKLSPRKITIFIGGINLPFPVMGGKNGMILSTLQVLDVGITDPVNSLQACSKRHATFVHFMALKNEGCDR